MYFLVFFLILPDIFGLDTLLCSQDNFLVTVDPEESTVFCYFQGQLLHMHIEPCLNHLEGNLIVIHIVDWP